MCLDDGAFVATDAGLDRIEGDDGSGGRTFRIDDTLAMSGMGNASAVRRVAADLENQFEEDRIREGVVTKEATLPLVVWASAVISVAAERDDSITMPATLAQVDADGYHETSTDSRIIDPAREFTVTVR